MSQDTILQHKYKLIEQLVQYKKSVDRITDALHDLFGGHEGQVNQLIERLFRRWLKM